MAGVYVQGEYVVLSGVFTRTTAPTGPADPDAVVVYLVRPSGDVETATAGLLTTPIDTPGDWEAEFLADEAGVWQYRVEGTGTLVATAQGAVLVLASVVPESGS